MVLMRTQFLRSSEPGFAGFHDWSGLGDLRHRTVSILMTP